MLRKLSRDGVFSASMKAILSLCGLVCLALPAAASIYGPGGLLLNPTADMPPKGEITPSALAIQQDGQGVPANRRTLASYGLTYGLSDNIEVGITHTRLNPTNAPKPDPSNGASLKWRLRQGRVDGCPDVVVGGNFLGGGDLDAKVGFLATRFSTSEIGSKGNSHLHLGLMYIDELYEIKRHKLVPFAGFDIPLAKKLRAFAEISTRADATGGGVGDVRAPHAYGLIWQPLGHLKIFAGMANNGQNFTARPSIGIGYTVGVRTSSR